MVAFGMEFPFSGRAATEAVRALLMESAALPPRLESTQGCRTGHARGVLAPFTDDGAQVLSAIPVDADDF